MNATTTAVAAPRVVSRFGAVERPAAAMAAPRATLASTLQALAPVAATVASIWLYAVACPPYDWPAAAWIAPGLLLVATRGLGWRRALACGFLFGALFGLWITGWTYHATLAYFGADRVRAGGFVLVMWLVYAGIPYGLAILAYGAAAPRVAPALRAVVGAWIWVASEWLRSTMLTGLPWELLGDTQYRVLPLIQIADLGGVYLVSFVVALASIAGAEAVVSLALRDANAARLGRRLAVPCVALTATLVYGQWAVAAHATSSETGARTVAVVQARVPTAFRWKRAFFHRTIAAYAGLTRTRADETTDLIVWPENAANFYLAGEPLLTAQLGTVAARARAGLVVGGPRLDADGRARNAAYLVGGDGTIRDAYDKQRLVPFAEYDPFRPLRPVGTGDPDTYVPGTVGRPLAADGLRLGTMICYEALFPHLVRDLVRAGADVLVNISNDAWLDAGDGAAPKQHFSHVVFRAIENRRYMVRASDSGMSGFVTPSGRIYGVVPEGEEGAATGRVVALTGITLYGRCGDAWIAFAGIALACAAGRRRSGRAREAA